MNKRIDPKAALDASARHLRQALRNGIGTSTSAEMRTTCSVDRDIHDALRLLAARHRCKLNDLVAIAVEDLLARQGALPGSVSRSGVRRRVGASAASAEQASNSPVGRTTADRS
jgi:hypothetical protein